MSINSKNSTRGFTLIELLVVIAIIGILASVVLASLNTARGKGANAAIKSNLSGMRVQAEIVYDSVTPNSYATVCADSNVIKALAAAANSGSATVQATNAVNTTTGVVCNNALASWVMQAALKVAEGGNAFYCVDHTGTAKLNNTVTAAAATVCP